MLRALCRWRPRVPHYSFNRIGAWRRAVGSRWRLIWRCAPSGLLLAAACNRRGSCGDGGNVDGVPAPEYLLCHARAPIVSLPWRDCFARACKFDLGVRGRGQQTRVRLGRRGARHIWDPTIK